jgi:hypothetical protein
MKIIAPFALWCVALAVSGCGSPSAYRATRRSPVWVLPVTNTVAPAAPPAVTVTEVSVTAPETNQATPAIAPASTNAPMSVARTNAPPPVANVLSLVEIKELAAKGVGEQTILNVLRASRVIYTLTAREVAELQAAKVSVAVVDYLLSTPLLYKDDLLRTRAYYYYAPVYPGYWHWSHHDFHHGVHYYDSHRSYYGSRIGDWHH